MQKSKFKTKQNGLTIVETLVSLLILTSGIIGVFSLIHRNVINATVVKDEVIAAQLAGEGIEVVRNIRDSDWHAGKAFGMSIPDGTYRVQWNSTSLLGSGLIPLKIDNNTGIYSYDGGTDTPFSRDVTISTNAGEAGTRKIVIVNVNWAEKSINKSVQAEEDLYNWK